MVGNRERVQWCQLAVSPQFRQQRMSHDELAITLALAGMPDDATFQANLPRDALSLSINELLEALFPYDEAERFAWEESFDLAANPDLPEIYEAFLTVVDQFRFGLCQLTAMDENCRPLNFESSIGGIATSMPQNSISPKQSIFLSLTPEYRVLEVGEAEGWDAGESNLMLWLRTCTAMYFLDKHEAVLPLLAELADDHPLKPLIGELEGKNLVDTASPSGEAEITPEGRKFIGSLLAETESYIDRYDLFGDVWWDEDTLDAEFGSGLGEDLRVSAFILEGLDPVRTVFLLRLYDGTLDEFVDSWLELVVTPGFFDQVLEPVLNRLVLSDELLEGIMEQGFELLENISEEAREERLRSRVLRRASMPGC